MPESWLLMISINQASGGRLPAEHAMKQLRHDDFAVWVMFYGPAGGEAK